MRAAKMKWTTVLINWDIVDREDLEPQEIEADEEPFQLPDEQNCGWPHIPGEHCAHNYRFIPYYLSYQYKPLSWRFVEPHDPFVDDHDICCQTDAHLQRYDKMMYDHENLFYAQAGLATELYWLQEAHAHLYKWYTVKLQRFIGSPIPISPRRYQARIMRGDGYWEDEDDTKCVCCVCFKSLEKEHIETNNLKNFLSTELDFLRIEHQDLIERYFWLCEKESQVLAERARAEFTDNPYNNPKGWPSLR